MVSLPSRYDNHQSTGGWSERTQCQAKVAMWNSFSYICTRALHSFRSFVQPPPLFLCCLRPPSHHPSSLTSVSLVPGLHWLRPSLPFWPYGTHSLFPHSQTISILSDLLYLLTPFLFQLSIHFPSLLIPNSIHSQHSNQTSKTLHLMNIHFLLSALLLPHDSAPYNAVDTITPSNRHFLDFIPNLLLLRALFSAPQALYPSFILCTTSVSHFISCHLRPQVLKTIHFL